MDIVIITKVAQLVQRLQLLPHYARGRRQSTPLVNCVVDDALVPCCNQHAVNTAITFYDFSCLNAYH